MGEFHDGATPGRGRLLVRDARLVPLRPVRRGRVDPLGKTAVAHDGPSATVDVRIADGVIAEVGPALGFAGEEELDAGGRWVMPGLWDQHVHFLQWARSASWLDVSRAADQDEVVARIGAHIALLRDAPAAGPPAPARQLVCAFGYRSALWPAPASVAELDAVSRGCPVVVIAGDAHNGWLSSRAQELLGVGPFDAAIRETAWFEVFDRLSELPGFDPTDDQVRRVVAAMAARGITGIVDLEFTDAFRDWPRRVAAGIDQLRVRTGVYPRQLDQAIGSGLVSGGLLPGGRGLVAMGPLKIISDGSLGTRTAWCCSPYTDADRSSAHPAGAPNVAAHELDHLVRTASDHGLAVTAHAIGDRANEAVLDAFARAGVGGRIEHAQLLRFEDVGRFADLGVVASMQPAHVLDDRDLADRCWADRTDRCFAARSLVDAGVDVVFGSDAPVSPVDPWAAIAAAVHRSGDERDGWHPEQSLTPAEALACSVDGQRIAPGGRGDLIVLSEDPLAAADSAPAAAARLRSMTVLATVCAGRVTHRAAAAAR